MLVLLLSIGGGFRLDIGGISDYYHIWTYVLYLVTSMVSGWISGNGDISRQRIKLKEEGRQSGHSQEIERKKAWEEARLRRGGKAALHGSMAPRYDTHTTRTLVAPMAVWHRGRYDALRRPCHPVCACAVRVLCVCVVCVLCVAGKAAAGALPPPPTGLLPATMPTYSPPTKEATTSSSNGTAWNLPAQLQPTLTSKRWEAPGGSSVMPLS